RLGDLYTMTREFENASIAFIQGRESAETREEQREFDLKIASVAFDRGDTSTGISRLREIMRNEPADDRDMTVRALLMTKLDLVKDRPVAEAIVAEMREIEGEAGLTWRVWSADILLTNHASAAERERILDSLQSVLAADPNHAGAICLLGKAYEQGRDWRAAETLYSNAWKRNPDNFEITYAYLNFLKSRGRDSELMDVVMQSKAVPNEVRSARRATELVQQDRPEEAIRMLQEHAETEPDDIPSRVLLAMLQFDKSKDESAAFAALDQIEADNGPSPSVARARVALLTELDRMDEAKKLIDARIEEAPKDYSLRETRGLLLHMMGDSEAALRDFQMLPELTTAGNAEGLIRFGQYLLEIGRVDEALELWERGLRDYPQSTLLRRNFVKALFYRNQPQDYARAAELIDSLEAATRSHVDPELMMFRALSMLDRRESPTAARELLTRALELNPTLHEAELALIRIEVMLGDLGSARRIAQAGIQKLAPTSTGGSLKVDELQHLGRLRTALAQIEEQAGDFAAAERLARLALDVDATNVEALELLFRASIAPSGDRNLTPVLRLVDQALAGAPYSQKLRILRSRILSTTGNVDQATAEIAKFIAENPEEAHAATYLQLANLREMQGDREGVAKAVQNAVEKEPRSYEAQNARIIFFGQTRDYKSIENLIPELMDGNHDAALSIVAAGQLVTASEPQYKELARKLLQSATARFAPDDAKQLIIGKLFYQLGDLDTTIKIYETFREKNPEHITALNDLAWFLGMERNRYDEAIALADRGVNLSPRHAELRDTRGNILYKNSKYVAAMVDFEVCAEAGLAQTQRARTQLMIARCASRLNDHEKARRAAEQALELAKGPNDLTEEENRELQELVVRQS
ncbi:MAG: tetratricopeptide repeat protein, partial [Phycisphaerae bacterium]